ncbi:MAG: sigma-70 family RNA polymerase sigma factor [Eubacterium sp.]|nr:sigma-70 family RNA polymerase sigma factor [Eubacterium sp.]
MEQMNAAEFVEENLKTIFAYALSRVSNKDDAEDLTNDIVLAILQSADKIKNPDAFYGYVWSIAANTYKKFIYRKNRCIVEKIDDNLPDDTDFTEELLAQEDIISLHREIAMLSKEYRECTLAYYYDGLSCIEISKKLNISLEMVKYYLFKTRKILKEGISMEREFGEKSFNPAPFEFATIFSGNYNSEYSNLFSRKLPGQILLSAYYTPMSVRELVIELGVASVYLEDEIALLEKYNLITKLPSKKHQTNLVIFTDDFTTEFNKSAQKIAIAELSEIALELKGKLEQIKKVNSVCERLSDSRLLWGLLWPIMRQGYDKISNKYPQYKTKNKIYDEAFGVNYGISKNALNDEFDCGTFAGYAGIDENYYASAADFGILPEKNRYFTNTNRKDFVEKIYDTVAGEIAPEFIILTEAEEQTLFKMLNDEISLMATLYDKLFSCACDIMHSHAPKRLGDIIDRVVFQTLFFRTVGLIGSCAVKSDMLAVPDFDGPAGICVCENTKQAKSSVNQNVQI